MTVNALKIPPPSKAAQKIHKDSALDARFSNQNSKSAQHTDKIGLDIGKVDDFPKYYEYAFTSLPKENSSHLAKAIIKRIEPCKRARHPYNGGKSRNPEKSKPNWWPEDVRHREPDHLLKKGQ
ncbi:uncharacterized protein BJX67DRAFT_386611 [Aspergillus lucknowensis]|uniref:Subtelomeric hrmA-associated cluster protein AFUB-079030/YDR124W-like helical bundle domain-containing protein n=1 Tax=Aspergillus lucknowensis TaxID=176173 RepID=A0ABR4L5J9_9EURO